MTISAWPTRSRDRARVLRASEYPAALEFCRQVGAQGVLAGAKIADLLSGHIASGQVWAITRAPRWSGQFDHTSIDALCWQGANLLPVAFDLDHAKVLAQMILAASGRPASIVGPIEAVMAMWNHLEPVWSRPRQVLTNQLLMEITGPPLWPADPQIKPAKPCQLEQVLPAAVAMFTEELGFPPQDPNGSYRQYVQTLLRRKAVFVKLSQDGLTVDFKADLGAVMATRAQVQGVWTRPGLRGCGVAKAGLAAVIQAANSRGIQAVSLYVNHFNHPAIAAYHAVGFRQIGHFATVML
ncbi:MAG: GNAT family N-acetyltransferase [Micrococcales bacterium]|nr:GNAT family N-acetyltransferase [Micrococcales bacterium]